MIWDRLSDEHKNIIRKGVAVGENVAWDIGTKSIANGERVAIEKYGVSITHLTPAEYKAFRRAVSSVHDKYRKIIGPEYYDFFVNEVEKLSK
jgi:TRAP-type C4-dicarboxylate transport system substrate-binding protein